MPKVCICFYGLVHRSLPHTIDSIEQNIFNVLKENNIEYDTYVHTWDASYAHSPRSDEIEIPIDPSCCSLLHASELVKEPYDDMIKLVNYKRYNDVWRDKYVTIVNWLNEIQSIKKVTTLWQPKKDEYTLYLYLRPDLKYHTPLPIKYLQEHLQGNVDKPVFFKTDWAGSGGILDYTGIGNYKGIIKWANRIDTWSKFATENAEKHVQWVLKDQTRCRLVSLPMLFSRVRSNKKIEKEGWQFHGSHRQICKSVGCPANC